MGEGAWQRARVSERPIEPLQSGQPRAGQGGAGSGVLAAGGAGPADRARRPSWLGTCGQARSAVHAAAERAARQPRGSHEQRRRGPTAARPWAPCSRSPAALRPRPALTMSICCCFFFRDYGSSKRKSGKGASGRFLQPPLLLRARASPALRRTFGGRGGVLACLTCGPAGPGFFLQLPCSQPMPHRSLLLSPSSPTKSVRLSPVGMGVGA